MGVLIDRRPIATDEKAADEVLVNVGRGGSGKLLFPLEYADQVGELVDAMQTASLCECVIHGCADAD
jgi:hypothetical protein